MAPAPKSESRNRHADMQQQQQPANTHNASASASTNGKMRGTGSFTDSASLNRHHSPSSSPKNESNDSESNDFEGPLEGPSPEDGAYVWSRMVFWWVLPLLSRSFREVSDLLPLPQNDRPRKLAEKTSEVFGGMKESEMGMDRF
jgi:hypothetical protein